MSNQTTGDAVRRSRMDQGVSLRALAGRVGISPATLSAIETGKTKLSVQRLQALAAALEITPAQLLDTPVVQSSRGRITAPATCSRDDWRTFEPLALDAILNAAIRSFVITGYHGATMRSIAELAGLSVPGVYHHYSSKQEILVRILDLTMGDLLWRMERARDEGTTPLERVYKTVEALALYHASRIDVSFIGASEMRSLEPEHYRRIASQRNQVQALLDEEIRAAIATGDLATEAPTGAGRAISAMCVGLAQWFRPDGRSTPEQVAAEYAGFALNLLKQRTS